LQSLFRRKLYLGGKYVFNNKWKWGGIESSEGSYIGVGTGEITLNFESKPKAVIIIAAPTSPPFSGANSWAGIAVIMNTIGVLALDNRQPASKVFSKFTPVWSGSVLTASVSNLDENNKTYYYTAIY